MNDMVGIATRAYGSGLLRDQRLMKSVTLQMVTIVFLLEPLRCGRVEKKTAVVKKIDCYPWQVLTQII